MRKKIFTFLLALAASVGLMNAQSGGISVTQFTIPSEWKDEGTALLASDLPGFGAADPYTTQRWNEVPSGFVYLIYAFESDGRVKYHTFSDGDRYSSPTEIIGKDEIYYSGATIYYTTGPSNWGPEVLPQVSEITNPPSEWYQDHTDISTEEMPGFVTVDDEIVKAWDGAPQGAVNLISSVGSEFKYHNFLDGVYQYTVDHSLTRNNVYYNIAKAKVPVRFYYTTGTIPGGSTPAPTPAESVTVVFEANNNQKEVEVTLPHTFACDFQNGQGELDGIIQELYALQYGGYCQAFNDAPTATGNAAVTAGKDGYNHYIAISEAFEGTATVTGNYIKFLDTEQMGNTPVDYTLTISVQGSTPAPAPTGLQVTELQVLGSWADNPTMLSTSDMPGFVAITKAEAQAWDAAPAGNVVLIFAFEENAATSLYFKNGVCQPTQAYNITHEDLYAWYLNGDKIFYTGGGSTPSGDEGKLPGAFTINGDGDYIAFSKGNLQYHCTNHVWQFATNQYDIIGGDNANISDSYDGWIDLFGYGTGNNPTLANTSYSAFSTFTDWGVNAISNGGNEANLWRTLTRDEWAYLFNSRTNASSKYGMATVANVPGVIVLPDVYEGSAINTDHDGWGNNIISSGDWAAYETAGAVFLPVAGYREGTTVDNLGSYGFYWSSTPDDAMFSYKFSLDQYVVSQGFGLRYQGLSVRLVQATSAPSSGSEPEPTEDAIVIVTKTQQSSYTQGSVTISCAAIGDSDGFTVSIYGDKTATITNSDASKIISKIELVPGYSESYHSYVRANGGTPASSSESLITFTNVNSNDVTLSITNEYIQIKEVRITLADNGGSTPAVDPTPTPSATSGIFAYNYDCSRWPAYPTKNMSCELSGFSAPCVGLNGIDCGAGNVSQGPWKVEFYEMYDDEHVLTYGSSWVRSNAYGILQTYYGWSVVPDYYDDPSAFATYAHDHLPIYKLSQWNGNAYQVVGYGFICAYAGEGNVVEHAALFIEATNDYGCFLSGHEHSASLNLTFDYDLMDDMTSFFTDGGGSSTPEIKLNANFGGTYDFADTEAFTDNGDGTATLSNIALEFGYYYNFRVKVDGVSMSDNHEFTRETPSCVISSGSGDVYYFQADVTGNYSFTWEYATNTLTIGYPEIQHTYTAVGQNLAIFSNSWDPSITANDLVLQEDGSYKWEKEKVAFTGAMTIQYRVCEDHAWDVAYPATSEQPASFEIPSLGDYKITITYNPVGNVISASAEKIAKPTIQLNGNFSGEWADTEAFEVSELPMHSYAKLTKLLEPGTYEFGVKVNGEWRANGSAYTRDNTTYIIEEGHTGNLTINVDVKGYYSFFWYYDDNRLSIDYSRVCGMYWKDVTAGNFEVTLGQEGEVTLPKVWATSMAFVSNIASGSDQVRLGSTDETVATIAYTLSMDGLGTLTFHQAGECDIYVVHDITDYYCYDSCAFHLTVHPAAPVVPVYTDADFAIDFMSDPYTVVGGGALPTGVEVAGDFHDAQHGYTSPVITIPVTAGNYLVKMGTCKFSNQDGAIKNEDGSVTYTTLATNTGVCYDANPSMNYVADIITIPSDQIIKVYGAQYTPYFSIEKMPEIPAFTDFEINFMSDPYGMISGAKPEGTVIAGSFHDGDHGYQNVEVTVPMKAGKYRLTLGACQFGNGAGNVMSETNIELASFDQNLGENKCYHQNPAENIISMIFDVDQDQTITIDCGNYTPYMKLEAVTSYAVEFALGDAEGTAPAALDVTIGENITMSVNKTMYKEGYTLTGWSDGVNTYPIGESFTPANDVVLTPVFTANEADLLNATTDVTVKWYFGGDNGAPTTSYEGTSGLLVAKATIGDKTVDVKLAIDATSGKFAPQPTTEWAQVGVGTIFTYPYKEGMSVNVDNYKSYVTYYIADAEGKVTCGENDYYSFIEVTYPASAPTTAVVIGDPNDAEQVSAFLSTYDGQTIDELIIDRPVLNNMYNTLCLPFDMNAAQIAASSLNGVEIREFTGASVEGTTLNLSVGDPVNAVVAGRPYFVKYSAASQLDDLHFEDVTINNALLDNMAVTFDGVTFKGTFTPFVMQNGLNFQGGYLFLGQNNQLFWPNTSNPLKPFRAYFYVDVESSTPGNAPKYRGMPARIVEGKNVATGVENAQSANQSTKVIVNGQLIIIKNDVRYNAQGQVVK